MQHGLHLELVSNIITDNILTISNGNIENVNQIQSNTFTISSNDTYIDGNLHSNVHFSRLVSSNVFTDGYLSIEHGSISNIQRDLILNHGNLVTSHGLYGNVLSDNHLVIEKGNISGVRYIQCLEFTDSILNIKAGNISDVSVLSGSSLEFANVTGNVVSDGFLSIQNGVLSNVSSLISESLTVQHANLAFIESNVLDCNLLRAQNIDCPFIIFSTLTGNVSNIQTVDALSVNTSVFTNHSLTIQDGNLTNALYIESNVTSCDLLHVSNIACTQSIDCPLISASILTDDILHIGRKHIKRANHRRYVHKQLGIHKRVFDYPKRQHFKL